MSLDCSSADGTTSRIYTSFVVKLSKSCSFPHAANLFSATIGLAKNEKFRYNYCYGKNYLPRLTGALVAKGTSCVSIDASRLDDMMKRKVKDVQLPISANGLGLVACGGQKNVYGIKLDFGVFVKKLLRRGDARSSQKISIGDEIIEINGTNTLGCSANRVAHLLQKAANSGYVHLVLSSDGFAKIKWEKFLDCNLSEAETVLEQTVKKDNSQFDQPKRPISVPRNSKMPVKTLKINKTAAGLGLKLEHHATAACLNGKVHDSVVFDIFRIASIAPGSDVAENGHLHIGDVIVEINHVPLDGKSLEEVQLLLIRQKLTFNCSVDISYIPANTALQTLSEVFRISGNATTTKNLQNSDLQADDQGSVTSDSSSLNLDQELLNDNALVKVRTLEMVTKRLGLKQCENIRELIHTEKNDLIRYGDFVSKLEAILSKSSSPAKDSSLYRDDNQHNEEVTILREKLSSLERINANLQDEINHLSSKLSELTQQKICDSSPEQGSYETKIRLLEEEIAHLQSSETSLVKLDEETENEKHLALIECECRKLKDAREAHEAAIQHLLIFVDKVSQSVFSRMDTPEAEEDLQKLSYEAQQLAESTRKGMQVEDLPYGWEKACLSDGHTFYIDHVNHVTSWTDPRESPADACASDSGSEIDRGA